MDQHGRVELRRDDLAVSARSMIKRAAIENIGDPLGCMGELHLTQTRLDLGRAEQVRRVSFDLAHDERGIIRYKRKERRAL